MALKGNPGKRRSPCLSFEEPLDRFDQTWRIDRFVEMNAKTSLLRLHPVLRARERGERDNGNGSGNFIVQFPDMAKHAISVHPRHHKITQHNFGMIAQDRLDCFGSCFHRYHVRAMQLRTLLSHQKHDLTDEDIEKLVQLTDGLSFSYLSLGDLVLILDRLLRF